LTEYFDVAEIYFEAYRKINNIGKLEKKSVFIMSEDPDVIKEAEYG
jgi:hypothetical protein